MFNEAELEKMVYETIAKNGWKYIPAEQLPRVHSDVLVEPMVKDALIRLNPEIAEDPSSADEVIYNTKTGKIHVAGCQWAKKCTVNCVKLERKEAIKRGGVPCKVCGGK